MLLIPLITLKLLIRMTLAIPTIYINLTEAATNAGQQMTKVKANIFWETYHWMFYIVGPILGILLDVSAWFIYDMFFVPCYFWNLCKAPKNGRSILQMLIDPSGNDQFEESQIIGRDQTFDIRVRQFHRRKHVHSRAWRRGW